jgi:Glucodextranase, domain B/PASTA domain
VLTGPTDETRVTDSSVVVRGTVSPSTATVTILGQRVAVSNGSFTTQVPLTPGTNIIDVLAGAPEAVAAMDAVRVYRQALVQVPNVSGDSPGDAQQRLRTDGFVAKTHSTDGFLDSLLPISDGVCGTTPPAGRSLPPGSTITIVESVNC